MYHSLLDLRDSRDTDGFHTLLIFSSPVTVRFCLSSIFSFLSISLSFFHLASSLPQINTLLPLLLRPIVEAVATEEGSA